MNKERRQGSCCATSNLLGAVIAVTACGGSRGAPVDGTDAEATGETAAASAWTFSSSDGGGGEWTPGSESGSSSGGDDDVPPTGWTRKGGSLSVDLQGWTSNPAIASSASGKIAVAWAQHLNPAADELSEIYAAVWVEGAWTSLGKATPELPMVTPCDAYDPSIAFLDDVIYVARYEGCGYGWPGLPDVEQEPPILVAHWDGTQWQSDPDDSNPSGALNTDPLHAARNPRLAVIDDVLYAAWVENSAAVLHDDDRIVLKRLADDSWSLLGTIAAPSDAPGSVNAKIIDLDIMAVDGEPHVVWSQFVLGGAGEEYGTQSADVFAAKVDGGALVLAAPALRTAADGYSNYLAADAAGVAPYVAWQEKTATGNYRVHVAHLDEGAWVHDGAPVNVDPASGEAGRPTLASDGDRVWVSWVEGGPGERAQLRARSLQDGVWSEPTGSLNQAPDSGGADAPALAMLGGVPQVAWAEADPASATKQIYVAGGDLTGDDAPVELTQYGADGPPLDLPANTWTITNAGGITDDAAGVGDEGFGSFHYVSAIERSVLFGKYHAGPVSYGENQNALMGYDSARNRWDILEITEFAWSESLPGIGHDEGHVAVDGERGLYLTDGNLTLEGETRFETYVYDLVAGRGKRMLPPRIANPGTSTTAAMDPVRRIAYVGGTTYEFSTNAWSWLPDCPGGIEWFAGMTYDPAQEAIVRFGGDRWDRSNPGQATWRIDLATKNCALQSPGVSPPPGPSHLAYNSSLGLVMALVTRPDNRFELWSFDAAAGEWSFEQPTPGGFPSSATGMIQYLTYDASADLLLLHNGTDLRNLWALRVER